MVKKKKESDNEKAELRGKWFVLGSCHSLRSGTEKQQWLKYQRVIPVQSCRRADCHLRDCAKLDSHEWFSTNLKNKVNITVKQT